MKIWSWGANTNSQLGLGYASEQESSPVEVKVQEPLSLEGVTPLKVTGGSSHTLLLAHGLPHNKPICVTPNFQILSYPHVLDIASGWDFSLYLDSEGYLYSFGDNSYSQLGRVFDGLPEDQEQSTNTTTKAKKSFVPEWGRFLNSGQPMESVKLSHISAGMRHATGINPEQQIYVWGDNSKNQLGPSAIAPNSQVVITKVPNPTRVIFPTDDHSFYKVRCGKDFTLALDETGCLFGCGQNKYGVLLHAPQDFKDFKGFTHIYERIPNELFYDMIKDIQCGWSHALVLLENGLVISWGRNNFGQLGRTSVNPEFDVEPGYVKFPEEIISIACGSEHNLALGKSGKVYAWGWNEHENCGVKSPSEEDNTTCKAYFRKDCIPFPTLVPFPEDVKISVIGCGSGSSFAISL